MCKSPLHPLLTALPKCEHHMHIEGALSPELLFELAAKNNVPLPSPESDAAFASVESLYARYAAFSSLDDFLAYYYTGFTVLRQPEDFEALAWSYFVRVAAPGGGNVRHAELFFDPQPHAARGVPLAAVVAGLAAAQRRAERELGLTSLLVPCLLRHLPVRDGEATFAALRDAGLFADGALAGLGLCSSERGRPPAPWRGVFAAARAAGLRTTAHAGEEAGPEYVAAALDELGAQRVDHGVAAAADPAVVARLARDGVLLTVCPLSNVRLGRFASLADVPIRTFLDARVRFSINSDDPAYFGGYIQDNYCAVQDAHALTADEWERVARDAIAGSWCAQERKDAILAEVDGVFAEWRRKAEPGP